MTESERQQGNCHEKPWQTAWGNGGCSKSKVTGSVVQRDFVPMLMKMLRGPTNVDNTKAQVVIGNAV